MVDVSLGAPVKGPKNFWKMYWKFFWKRVWDVWWEYVETSGVTEYDGEINEVETSGKIGGYVADKGIRKWWAWAPGTPGKGQKIFEINVLKKLFWKSVYQMSYENMSKRRELLIKMVKEMS